MLRVHSSEKDFQACFQKSKDFMGVYNSLEYVAAISEKTCPFHAGICSSGTFEVKLLFCQKSRGAYFHIFGDIHDGKILVKVLSLTNL